MDNRNIHITKQDYDRLSAMLFADKNNGFAGGSHLKDLGLELQKAVIVESREIPSDVVTMNSKIRLLDIEAGETMDYTLVFPQDADIDRGMMSVMSPVGTAVLGYAVGDEIEWPVPDGTRRIKIEKILYQPEAAGHFNL